MADIRYAQFCPMTRAVEILGERWTLLLLRELVPGPQRFSDLKDRLPGVSSSVLAGRLARLEEKGLIARRELPPPAASMVYELAEAGTALRPVMVELIRWGMRFLGEPCPDERFEPTWLLMGLQAFARREPTRTCSLRIVLAAAPVDIDIFIAGGPEGTEVSTGVPPPPRPAEACLRTKGMDLLMLVNGLIDVNEAIASGRIQLEGDASVAAALPELFDFHPPADAAAQGSPTAPARGRTAKAKITRNTSRHQINKEQSGNA